MSSEIVMVSGCYAIVHEVTDEDDGKFMVVCIDYRGVDTIIGIYDRIDQAEIRMIQEKKPDFIGGVNIITEENLFDLPVHYPRAGG